MRVDGMDARRGKIETLLMEGPKRKSKALAEDIFGPLPCCRITST